jgi:tRNA1(Val) A37 N6-methylase TrmN6
LAHGSMAMDRLDMQTDAAFDVTEDVFLGDQLTIRQPAKGYRAGIDAVLLAATARVGEGPVLDIGAGVGTVGLCAAIRCKDLSVVLVEREAEIATLARANIAANGLSSRVTVVEADIGEPLSAAALQALQPDSFAHVLANPPFHDDGAGTPSASFFRNLSHSMAADALETWLRFMARMTAPGGRATMIHKAEALPRILKGYENRFGAIAILPIYPREGAPAIRVIIEGIKGSRAPLVIKPGLILHGDGNAFRPDMDAILRQGAGLSV